MPHEAQGDSVSSSSRWTHGCQELDVLEKDLACVLKVIPGSGDITVRQGKIPNSLGERRIVKIINSV